MSSRMFPWPLPRAHRAPPGRAFQLIQRTGRCLGPQGAPDRTTPLFQRPRPFPRRVGRGRSGRRGHPAPETGQRRFGARCRAPRRRARRYPRASVLPIALGGPASLRRAGLRRGPASRSESVPGARAYLPDRRARDAGPGSVPRSLWPVSCASRPSSLRRMPRGVATRARSCCQCPTPLVLPRPSPSPPRSPSTLCRRRRPSCAPTTPPGPACARRRPPCRPSTATRSSACSRRP